MSALTPILPAVSNQRSYRKPPIRGWGRFGLYLASFVSIILSILASALVIVGIIGLVEKVTKGSGILIGILLLGLAGGIAAGVIGLAVFLNRKLKQGRPLDPKRPNPFTCQSCRSEAPTFEAGLNRHIGMIVLMNHRSVRGRFCRECFTKTFWEYTLMTFFLGWWGIISCVVTPVVLINNLAMFCRSLSLQPKDVHAVRPTLSEQQILHLQSAQSAIAERLASLEEEESVTRSLAAETGLTPGQVYLFVRPIADAARQA